MSKQGDGISGNEIFFKVIGNAGGNKKNDTSSKRKGINVRVRLKKGIQILKPNNNGSGLNLQKGFDSFNDGARMKCWALM